jgi:hypothetical protein
LLPAVSAQNCTFTEFLFRPRLRRVSGDQSMTLMARKPFPAAFELNRNDVALAMIMGTPRLRIDIYAQDGCVANLHGT